MLVLSKAQVTQAFASRKKLVSKATLKLLVNFEMGYPCVH
jgi:hypothetical protein